MQIEILSFFDILVYLNVFLACTQARPIVALVKPEKKSFKARMN
jgi:hypothetical protein